MIPELVAHDSPCNAGGSTDGKAITADGSWFLATSQDLLGGRLGRSDIDVVPAALCRAVAASRLPDNDFSAGRIDLGESGGGGEDVAGIRVGAHRARRSDGDSGGATEVARTASPPPRRRDTDRPDGRSGEIRELLNVVGHKGIRP